MCVPEIDLRCPPLFLSTLCFETGSSVEPGAHCLDGQPASARDPPVSASPALELQICVYVSSFYMGAGDRIQVFMLVQQAHANLGISPARE